MATLNNEELGRFLDDLRANGSAHDLLLNATIRALDAALGNNMAGRIWRPI